jgi:hypothetical protein
LPLFPFYRKCLILRLSRARAPFFSLSLSHWYAMPRLSEEATDDREIPVLNLPSSNHSDASSAKTQFDASHDSKHLSAAKP